MPQHTPPEIFAIVPARGKADSHALAPQIHAWLHARGYATIDEASIRRGGSSMDAVLCRGPSECMAVSDRGQPPPVIVGSLRMDAT